MKTFLLSLFTILTLLPELKACNTCGCGVANYHYGILPQYHKNFIGLRYRYRTFDSQLDPGHQALYSHETYQTAELWGRFYPFKRLQAFLFVPYNINERSEGDKSTNLEGLGDIVISANYNLLNTYDSSNSTIKHNLMAGAGVKLPTGEFQALQDGLTINQNFQLGTGSVDFLLSLIYTMRINRLGLNTEFTYNINTTNRDEYQFGNTSRSGLSAFYVLPAGNITVMPNAGISLETFEDNEQFNQKFQETGGSATLYNLGIESYFKRVAIGITFSQPARQQLFDGKVQANNRLAMHFTYMF